MRKWNLKIRGMSPWRAKELQAVFRQYRELRKAGRIEAKMIEDAIRKADPAGYDALMKSLCDGLRYVECGYYGSEYVFYAARRRAIVELNKARYGAAVP